MSSFLIDKNSPIRTMGESTPVRESTATRLRHRSRHSESEQNNSFHGQNTPHENRKPEFEGLITSACTDIRQERVDHPMHDGFQPSRSRSRYSSTSMIGYFMSELMKGYKLEDDARKFVERRDRVYTSVYTPKNFEKFCAFGFLQCLDSILYIVTFLPLRIVVALVQVITYPFSMIFLKKDSPILDSAQICDLLKGVILVVSCCLTRYMDMSMIYHMVRGQSIIKFYVFYNMLDVMDKLISGFGQDVLDSLYWTAVEPRGRKREHFGTIFHLILAIFYVILHTMMILIQAIILNVAFNSHNKNLLTIMLSNNFVELKGNLFKRLDKNNLCQITYSDVKERFHYLVLLLFVLIRNMKELEWSWALAFPLIQDAVIVFGVEIAVDWVKHAFITKFNELSPSFYQDFALGLAQDIASSRKKHAFTDFSDQVCRRMGFTPIPLICLLFMVCSKSFSINGTLPWFLVFLFYLCLVSTKVLNSIILLGWAQHLTAIVRTKDTKPSGTVVNSQVIPKKEDKTSAKKSTLPPEPTNMDGHSFKEEFIPPDGVSVMDDIPISAESPIPASPSPYNGKDNSFDFRSSSSHTSSPPPPTPTHSRHHVSLTSSIDEFLVSTSQTESDASPEIFLVQEPELPPSHKPCHSLPDAIPLAVDFNSSETFLNVDDLVESELNKLSSSCSCTAAEDNAFSPLASRNQDSCDIPKSEVLSEHGDQIEAVQNDVTEPFMFKLSNNSRSLQEMSFVLSTTDSGFKSGLSPGMEGGSLSANNFPALDLTSDRQKDISDSQMEIHSFPASVTPIVNDDDCVLALDMKPKQKYEPGIDVDQERDRTL